jgi:hypothetical protein
MHSAKIVEVPWIETVGAKTRRTEVIERRLVLVERQVSPSQRQR